PITVTVHESDRGLVATDLARRFPLSGGFPAGGELHDLHVLAYPGDGASIARRPDVLYVGPAPAGIGLLDEMSDQVQAGNVSGATVFTGYETWLATHGLSGAGQVVSITDSGIDPVHPDLRGRIRARIDYAPLGQTDSPVDEPVDTLGHGTHVAGIVAGDANGLQPVTRAGDGNGFLYGLGVAPKAELVDQNLLSTTASAIFCPINGIGFWPPPYPWDRLTRDALANGASLWNGSWWSCEDSSGRYIATNRTFDQLTRDADPTTSGNQPFTFVFAAANFGPSSRTVAAPASAKNVISVGATLNQRAGNIDTIADFSSRGPAFDTRILPTVSAPGDGVISTRSSASTAACSVPVANGFTLYSSCRGTSMASPHVAGAVALLREWWRKSNPVDPSPAMTKALLVNTATDMGVADIPNPNEGWGRVNLGTLFAPDTRVYEDQTTVLTELDETATYRVRAADPSKPLKITVAWTDPAGAAGANPALVNDLDLRVVSESGAAYWGNRFNAGRSTTGGAPNRRDNLEAVFLASPGDQVHDVSITAYNLPGDGAPGGDQTDQDFALVISNGVIVAG
ncbi:MAG TPA: S8 family serine peptidase, partial [Actinomycetota bacterium]|nr:S8 family serine peptidase [Actinomycetota bacterium]